MKPKEKEKAIKLRKQGKTYNDILKEVSVSKSTLSLWLRDVGLSKQQKQKISARKRIAQLKGALARRKTRRESTQKIFKESIKSVGQLSKRERWLIGATLYWAEGSKEKSNNIGQGVEFCNTDAEMIRFFLDWLEEFFSRTSEDISFGLYIHENHKYRTEEVVRYWRKHLKQPDLKISYIYYKKHNPKTVRKKVSETSYNGTLRVYVKKSTNLQRKIHGTVYGITGQPCPVV